MDTAIQHLSWYDDATTKNCKEIIRANKSFFEELSAIHDIIVIGHSLAKCDWDYFTEITHRSAVNKWYITWHSERDLENIAMFVREMGIGKECVSLMEK